MRRDSGEGGEIEGRDGRRHPPPQPDPSQGAKPDSNGPSQLTAADLATMSAEDIVKADEAGRLEDLKRQGR